MRKIVIPILLVMLAVPAAHAGTRIEHQLQEQSLDGAHYNPPVSLEASNGIVKCQGVPTPGIGTATNCPPYNSPCESSCGDATCGMQCVSVSNDWVIIKRCR